MTPELWKAKKIVDSTLHPGMVSSSLLLPWTRYCMKKNWVVRDLHPIYVDTGEPVFLPFRMSCFVLSNLVVTVGMLTPGLGVSPTCSHHTDTLEKFPKTYHCPPFLVRQNRGTVAWQIANQSLNVAINYSNSNKSSPLSWSKIAQSYFLAVGASCSVAVGLNSIVPRLKSLAPSTRMILGRLVPFAAVASAGALNVFLMRGEEIRTGIDVYPVLSEVQKKAAAANGEKSEPESLGKSKKAATLAVAETALSRVLNSSPIMVIPPLILFRLQGTNWLKKNPRYTTPVNLGLILVTSYAVLPLALAAFPQMQKVRADSLEEEFRGRGGEDGMVVFNRGI